MLDPGYIFSREKGKETYNMTNCDWMFLNSLLSLVDMGVSEINRLVSNYCYYMFPIMFVLVSLIVKLL